MTQVRPEEEEAERVQRVRAAHLAAAARAQAAAAQRARANADARSSIPNWTEAERTGAYAGLVTRTIAYCLDIAVINLVAFLTGAAVALAASLVGGLPDVVKKAGVVVGGVAYVLWVIGYFVTFWSTTGQTLGSRVMRIRVTDALGAAKVTAAASGGARRRARARYDPPLRRLLDHAVGRSPALPPGPPGPHDGGACAPAGAHCPAGHTAGPRLSPRGG